MPLRRLGEYELLRKIGSGGMAEVWMGRRAAMAGASKAVAIKLLARELLDDPNYRQMFLDEARLSMLLTNSNVVQVFDVGEIDGECFMVMEWVDGLNLSELSRKMLREGERLPTLAAAHVVGEILRALAYAHGLHHEGSKATIVHRDVSPQNVIVSVSGEVKLADFGVARLAREETSGLHVKGKLRYMAPEQLRGRSREPTVDLYAVGAILHELLEGERFRRTQDEGDLYSMVLSGEYPALSGELPEELRRLHAGLLEPDPSQRIQTADEALELLYSWADYRNSSIELGRLIRRWVGVGAPRSGIVSAEALLRAGSGGSSAATRARPEANGRGQGSAALASAAATVPVSGSGSGFGSGSERGSGPSSATAANSASPSAAVTAVDTAESGPLADRGATETRTWMSSAPETDATAVIPEAGAPARAPVSSLLIVAAVTLALSFGVFGLGFPLGWWGGGAEVDRQVAKAEGPADREVTADPSQAAAPPQPDGASQPTVPSPEAPEPRADPKVAAGDPSAVGPASPLASEPTPVETGEADDSQVAIAPEPTAEADSKPDSEPPVAKKPKQRKPRVDRTPAKVEFIAHEFLFVWVKVDGKKLALEPVAELELPPGRYPVSLRQTAEDEWQTAKSIEIEPGKRYKVRMTKPAGLKLEEQ